MHYNTVIAKADKLRPNAIDPALKYGWISEIDGKIAELKGVQTFNPYPNDGELLMPFPYENIYELYLIAMIDIYNQDADLYQADYVLFNQAYDEAKAFIIRTEKPKVRKMWSVM